MADPLLDEKQLLEDLTGTPVTRANIAKLQMACVGVMCDLYDRKVTRDQYTTLLGPVVSLYGTMAKIYMLGNVRDSMRQKTVTVDDVNQAIASLEDNARTHMGYVRSIVESLMECPTSEDKIQ